VRRLLQARTSQLKVTLAVLTSSQPCAESEMKLGVLVVFAMRARSASAVEPGVGGSLGVAKILQIT
jgi:hypothetical protein